MNAALLLLTATAALCLIFAAVFLIARRIDNYGIVDIAWSYAFAALAAFYALAGSGWPVRRALIGTLACLWSLRLGTHLYVRVMGHHPVEDGRYLALRQRWAANFTREMFKFFQMQAVSVVLLGAAFLVASINPRPTLHPLEITGALLWLIALTGEALADRQLAAFKHDSANRGRVCATGLWRYSRHPNYFFEWLVWVAFFVFALGSPWGWVAMIGPASILWLLLRVERKI